MKIFLMSLRIALLLFAANVRAIDFEDAKWIWYSPDPAHVVNNFPEETIHLRQSFVALGKIKSAEIVLTCDNLFTLYVNGKSVGESDEPNAWNQPKRFDVSSLVVTGRNFIAIEAANTAPGAAGLIVKFVATLEDGKQISLASDAAWKASDTADVRWEQPDFDDSPWPAAVVVVPYGAGPWGKLAVPAAGEKPGEAPRAAETEAVAANYPWPDAIAFIGDDCSLYRPRGGTGTGYDSLSVTIFNPRDSRAFPEHDLPAPMKVGHKLCVLKPARPGVAPQTLLDAGTGAIGSPSVSFDGKMLLVTMAKEGDAFFHIYKIPAKGGAAKQLTSGPFFDIDPAELPDGRIVFTSTRIGTFEEYHNPPSRSLFVMNADGSNIHPITQTFIFDNEPEVMADGRILFIRSDNFFDRGKVETLLHAIHPDGTDGYTEFGLDIGPDYGGRLRAFNCGSPAPMADGRVAFVSGGDIVVAYPGSAQREWKHIPVEAGDVAAMPDGRLICTVPRKMPITKIVRKQKKIVQSFSYEKIAVVDSTGKDTKPKIIFDSPDAPLHSPVFLGPRLRPPQLVQRVDEKKADDVRATGVFFCQNARFTKNTTAGWPNVRAIRVLAGHGLTMRSSHSYIVHAGSDVTELGTVPLAPDGSFAVEVPADTAIAFQAVDAEGRSELNEMSWIYVRPGETRGCFGCHQPRQNSAPSKALNIEALKAAPLKLLGEGHQLRFRGNNAAVTGEMELQFDRYREVAGINRHADSADPLATGTGEVAALIAQLKDRDISVAISAAQRLAVFRDHSAAPALAGLLGVSIREARVAAAFALAACGTRDSVTPLLAALNDTDPLVAQASAIALENLTGHSEAFDAFASSETSEQQSVESWRTWLKKTSWDEIERELAGRLSSTNRDVVRRAAVALGHVGGDGARGALRDYVARERENNLLPEWRKQHQGDGARFNSLEPMNPRTIQAATRSLGYLHDSSAVPMLAETLNKNSQPANGNLFLAEAAAEALGRIATPDAESKLVDSFKQLGAYQNYSGWYGDHGALIACHSSPVHYFIAESLDAMGSTNCAAILPLLIQSVPTDPDRALLPVNDDYETVIGRNIRRNGAESRVVETCLAILGDSQAAKDDEIAKAISVVHGAWGGTPGPEIRGAQILSLACRDRKFEPRVRAAFERYRDLTNDIKRVFDTGIPVVNKMSVKHWTSFFLARTLGNLASPQSFDTLLAALEKYPTEAANGRPDPLGPGCLFIHNDLTPCWRAEAAWALGRIGDKRAAPVLAKVIANLDNAPDTRHAAAESLAKIGGAKEAARLAANYPDIATRKVLLRAVGGTSE